jgi:hypothetical protein
MSGSAWVFGRDPDTGGWVEQTRIFPPLASSGQQFGFGTDIHGEWMVIAAPFAQFGDRSGAVYLYRKGLSGEWTLHTEIRNPESVVSFGQRSYGYSVALAGERLIVGASSVRDPFPNQSSGSAFVYYFDGTAWTQEVRLRAPENLQVGDFGVSVDMDAEYAIVGAYGNSELFQNNGAAYVFQRAGSVWHYHAKLMAPAPTIFASFGAAVAINRGRALVGAPRDGAGLALQEGAAYLFDTDGTTWTYRHRFNSPDDETPGGHPGDSFGTSVELDGARALIGAPQAWTPFSSGAAYLYDDSSGAWELAESITPQGVPNTDYPQFVGSSVFMQGSDAGACGLYSHFSPTFTSVASAWTLDGDQGDLQFAVEPTPVTFAVDYLNLHAEVIAHFYGVIRGKALTRCGERAGVHITEVDLRTVEPEVELRLGPLTWMRVENPRVRLGNGFGIVGPPAPLSGDDFTQRENTFAMFGHVRVSILGMEGEGEASDADISPLDLSGSLSIEGAEAVLRMPMDFEIVPHTGLPWGDPVASSRAMLNSRAALCIADFNRNGTLDFFDYLDFAIAFDAEESRADFNADGQIDFFDYLDFVNRFSRGCE